MGHARNFMLAGAAALLALLTVTPASAGGACAGLTLTCENGRS